MIRGSKIIKIDTGIVGKLLTIGAAITLNEKDGSEFECNDGYVTRVLLNDKEEK